MFKHVPNILTIIRFLLIPIIIKLIVSGDYLMAFLVITLSGITDVLDGFIARKYNFISNFGKLVDPLADKFTQIAILATLGLMEIIPLWILIVVLIKEFLMISAASFLYGKDFIVSSKWYGKLATVLFYLAIVCSLLIQQFESNILSLSYGNMLIFADNIIYYLALATTIFALIMYTINIYKNGAIQKEDLTKEVTKIDKMKK